MQNSNRNSVETALQKKALETSIQAKIKETVIPAEDEIKALRHENEQLRKQLKEKEEKYSSIRQQLQLLTFLLDLGKLTHNKKVEQIGTFFSALLNRNSQRAREQFSSIGKLFYSANKSEAKLIKKDLLRVQALLCDFGLKAKAKLAEAHIKRLDEKHFSEDL